MPPKVSTKERITPLTTTASGSGSSASVLAAASAAAAAADASEGAASSSKTGLLFTRLDELDAVDVEGVKSGRGSAQASD